MSSISWSVILIPLLLLHILNIHATGTLAVTPEETTPSFFINCGLLNDTNDLHSSQNRDELPIAPPNLNAVSTPVYSKDPTADPLHKVTRVFWSAITYTLSNITSSPIFLRLYFSSNVSFNNTLTNQFSTSLVANDFTLLKNFNPFINSLAKSLVICEFQLILRNGENNVSLTFSPGHAANSVSYGYVNAIEIESVPKGLYINEANLSYKYVATHPNTSRSYTLDKNAAAFQTAFRLNVGGYYGQDEDAKDTSGGMNRTWEADDAYFLMTPSDINNDEQVPYGYYSDYTVVKYTKKTPPYVAPELLYQTYRIMGDYDPKVNLGRNLTWLFQVDPGFDYVVRLHFLENNQEVTEKGQRLMCVYIGGYVADPALDIWAEAGGNDIPIYKDYVITVQGKSTSNASKVPLSLALHPHLAYVTDVILNGVEILKLSNSDRNLAHHLPPRNRSSIPIIIGGSIGGVLLVIVLLLSILRCRVRSLTATARTNLPRRPSIPLDVCRRFSLSQIKVATREFDPKSVIGRGGFGKVYKGCIYNDGGATNVAIKRLNSTSNQGEHEFLTEIKMLSRLRHKHLVSLIGYCDDKGEMILVYEYMPRGTLRDHLKYRDSKRNDNNDDQLLSWKQRLAICLGAARGLEYLHAGTQQLIIHRDVKSTNILLDENWTAKVSDFGLSKVGPASDTGVGHVNTAVKGSFGYLDPEYYQRGQLTEKSDVYSFGVMLFEVLCAQPAVSLNLPKVRACCNKGTLHTIVDPTLTGQITPECLSKYGEIAEMCVRGNRDERPSMRDVVWSLEFMLTLQQTAENTSDDASPMVEITIRSNAGYDNEDGESTLFQSRVDEDGAQGSATIDNTHMDVKSSSVFSDLQAR